MNHSSLRRLCRTVGVALLLAIVAPFASAASLATHVIVVGVDGLSPFGIEKTNTPNIDSLRARGAGTWHARNVFPTSSSPNWASMIMGAPPEMHGVTSNDWELDQHPIEPVVKGPGGMFPTIFGVLRQQRPDAVIAVFHDWVGFARLLETKMCDVVVHSTGAKKTSEAAFKTAAAAAAYFKSKRPTFMFIHLDHVDHAGHGEGWMSEPYEAAVREADQMLGQIVAAVDEAGATDRTIILLTADHGGIDKKHGGFTLQELEIPWVIAGPGVKRGYAITAPVNTYDTAATIAYVLGVTPPTVWIGRPVASAFAVPPGSSLTH